MAESNVGTRAVDSAGFADVDRTNDPQARVHYLDLVTNTIPYKRDALAALSLKPGSRVLDVGCGTGDDCRLLAELVGPAGHVVGLDASATMIAEARRRGQGTAQAAPIAFQLGDIYALPFPDDTFDAARADRVFQHLTDPLAALAEMRRVTRPGGVLSVFDPDFETLVVDVPNRPLFRKIRGHYLDTNNGRYRGSQLYGLLHRAGLGDVRVASTNFATFTDYTLANQVFDLREVGDAARAAGVITAEEHAEWMDALRALQEPESFFLAAGAIGVTGTKG